MSYQSQENEYVCVHALTYRMFLCICVCVYSMASVWRSEGHVRCQPSPSILLRWTDQPTVFVVHPKLAGLQASRDCPPYTYDREALGFYLVLLYLAL